MLIVDVDTKYDQAAHDEAMADLQQLVAGRQTFTLVEVTT